MKQSSISAAFDQVNVEPSPVFRSKLRAAFIDAMTHSEVSETLALDARGPAPTSSTAELRDGYVGLAASPSVVANRSRRLVRVGLAAATSIALLVTAAIVVTRVDNSPGELNDVNAQDALPLARKAFISGDALGHTYFEAELPLPELVENNLAAVTRAAMPECEILATVGLMQPSPKAVAASQFFTALGGIAHTVYVFATPQDASKAMDVIGGKVYPACRFDLFDRMIPLEGQGHTANSKPWQTPTITAHGDRQIVFGQHTKFTGGNIDRETFYVNVFVQVGRAITWMNPQLLLTDKPLFLVNKAAEAQTAALESVFGH